MSNATRLLDILRKSLSSTSTRGNQCDVEDEYMPAFVTDVRKSTGNGFGIKLSSSARWCRCFNSTILKTIRVIGLVDDWKDWCDRMGPLHGKISAEYFKLP